jgi:nuclear cap-binding protein subunit 1
LLQAVGIELVKIILLTLPYLIAASRDPTIQQRAAELLEKTEIVATAPHAMENLIDPYAAIEEGEKPMAFGSVVSLLQRQLQDEATNGWPLTCIPRIFDPAPASEANGNGDSNGDTPHEAPAKHAYPEISIPSPVVAGPGAIFSQVYFSLYADQEVESVPPTTNVASSLIRDSVVDTINILDFNRNAAAKFLTEIDNFWAPGTFTRRETQFDRLRDYAGDASTWKSEDVAIDAVFSQIFQLPASQHRLVYYHSVITEVCKLSPQAIAPSLGRAIRFLYRSIDNMDLELSYRFMDWFAHHLSNFEFRWKWSEWYVCCNPPQCSSTNHCIGSATLACLRSTRRRRSSPAH